MRNLLLACVFLSGCASFNGLEPRCQGVNEKEMGEVYSANNIPVGNFERFANQCAKYGYRVPSMERFLESYHARAKAACESAKAYFQYSLTAGNTSGNTSQCEGQQVSFDRSQVAEDALEARFLKKSIQELDAKLDESQRSGGKKKYSNGFLLDALLRAAYESNPQKLEEQRSKKSAQLSAIAQKYGMYSSEI